MAKDPQQRYGSAGALIKDVDRVLAGKPITHRPLIEHKDVGSWLSQFVPKLIVWCAVVAAVVAILKPPIEALVNFKGVGAPSRPNPRLVRIPFPPSGANPAIVRPPFPPSGQPVRMGYPREDYRGNSNGYGGAGGGGNTGAQQESGSHQQYKHYAPGSFGQSANHGYYKANSNAPNVPMNSNAEPQTGQSPSPQQDGDFAHPIK